MKIRRIKLDGFGALRGEYAFDPSRLTLLLDDNERGKSTLLAAICAGLYGLPNDRRSHKMLTPLERWRPWDGGSYRVELEAEAGGERLWIRRDFERETVEVWDERGQDVTARFREGRDEYPVGRQLLGLDAVEFEKCAFVRQGDLEDVVPAEAKDRGLSTLAARLETAADSHVGDTSASEAVKVLEDALRRYTCPEVESSGLVDTAIQRLELKRATLDTELHTLDQDFEAIRAPLDELTTLDDEERAAREALAAVDRERHAGFALDLRRQIEEDDRHRAEVRALEAEAASLAGAAHLPVTAEAQFRETFGRYEEVRRNLETLEQRAREDVARRRESLDREIADLSVYEGATAEDADRCVSLAAELRRAIDDQRRLRDEVFNLRESLAGAGHEPERFQWLQDRFGALPAEKQALLRRQSEQQLAYQTEVATLERDRTQSSETLRGIDAGRMRWRLPAWFLTAFGIAAIAAAVAVMLLKGLAVLWGSLAGAGALLVVAGLALMASGGRARESERIEALRRLTEAQRRLAALKQTRAETEVSLQILARQMNYRDQVDLLREWGEYVRVLDESGPVLRAQDGLTGLEQRRERTLVEAAELLARFGIGEPDPQALEKTAHGIRRSLAVRQAARDIERQGSRLEEERRVVEAEATGYRERAIRLLQSAGLLYDPERTWEQHAEDLGARVRERVRLTTITQDLLPRARTQLLHEGAVGHLRAQLEAVESSAHGGGEAARMPLELEAESRRQREALDSVQRRRQDLRVRVEEVWRRYHAEHPAKAAQRERVEQALGRARRFKHAVELARDTVQSVAADTHRRWADHLNQRVGEILAGFGTGIGQVRFGDDLDFSVRMPDGRQLARGRADLQLSAGAREQLYLAVRLAIAEFLSRAPNPVPMLLDDVFANSDDDRTRAGMRLLIERLSATHQVILLTCHRTRHEALAKLDPELYGARVQWLDARSMSAARA